MQYIPSCSVVGAPEIPLAELYLFCEHLDNPRPEWCHSLYKISIASTSDNAEEEEEEEELSPIVKFPEEEYPTQGMRCARLGSKFYFLGGSKLKDGDPWHPRDVYSFDILTGDFRKMEDAPLNAGKPHPCVVFAADGKLYALARIPNLDDIDPSERPLVLSEMNLFECFDPATNKWEVLENLPPVDVGKDWAKRSVYKGGINWVGCTVMEKHQQVVLIGKVFPFARIPGNVVKLVYHLEEGNWTCDSLPTGNKDDILVALSFQEGTDGSCFYGLPRDFLPPVKSKSDFLSKKSEDSLFDYDLVPVDVLDEDKFPDFKLVRVKGEYRSDYPADVLVLKGEDIYDFKHVSVDGVVDMCILDKTKKELCDWFLAQRRLYTSYWYKRLLRHIGNDYFCYVSSGMLPSPESHRFCHRLGYERDWDIYALGITITLFKEMKDKDKDKDEEELLFQAQMLHSESYVIRTPFVNHGDLKGCFFVTPDQLQKEQDKSKKKKRKRKRKVNLLSFGSTIG